MGCSEVLSARSPSFSWFEKDLKRIKTSMGGALRTQAGFEDSDTG